MHVFIHRAASYRFISVDGYNQSKENYHLVLRIAGWLLFLLFVSLLVYGIRIKNQDIADTSTLQLGWAAFMTCIALIVLAICLWLCYIIIYPGEWEFEDYWYESDEDDDELETDNHQNN